VSLHLKASALKKIGFVVVMFSYRCRVLSYILCFLVGRAANLMRVLRTW
jgi:hypothetical protein